MSVTPEQLKALHEPFSSKDVEWRAQMVGKNNNGWYVLALAYIDNRAIMERLDAICGEANWQNRYEVGAEGALSCGIGIRIDAEWVWKWDGAGYTSADPKDSETRIKGGYSASMKRAAVQWGIGRYLYKLPATFVPKSNILEARPPFSEKDLWTHAKGKQGGECWWKPPLLPTWALPADEQDQASPPQARPTKPEVKAAPLPDPPKPEEFVGSLPACTKYNKELLDEYKSSIDAGEKDEVRELLDEMVAITTRYPDPDDVQMLHVFMAELVINRAAEFNKHQAGACYKKVNGLELPLAIKNPMLAFIEAKGKSLG